MELHIEEKHMPIETPTKPQKISYEDILSKMGMFVSNGKLQLAEKPQTNSEDIQVPYSYIHNKYFKDEIKPKEKPPTTPEEYRKKIINDYNNMLEMQRVKSKNMFIPHSTVQYNKNRFNMRQMF
jgi:hypothetical protein